MLFNSFTFALFLPIVFILYWFVTNRSLKLQNLLLLFASYYFYANWDWRFMFLLIFSTFLDYYTGLKMYHSANASKRKFWLWLSIGINLGFLGIFKYYNFFAESFAELFQHLGFTVHPWTLKVILPVGISFYTFHGLSYVIDIYKKRIPAERNIVDYSVFVSFFPLLVAGPIERATHLLPQIKRKRIFNYAQAADGLRQILWGLFMKVVVADNCAIVVNEVFKNQDQYNAPSLITAAVFFAFQIYGDFSGYSNIALGSAKLFGIDLLKNFAFPYFSRDIAEFWRRWHISLSSWFKDYLYIPLGGSRGGQLMVVRNTFIIFLVSGFWHGANWTFIIWGLLNALYIMPLILFKLNRKNTNAVAELRVFPNMKELLQMLFTFAITVIAWVFFRSETVAGAFNYLGRIADLGNYALPQIDLKPFIFIFILIIVEWLQRTKQHGLQISHLKSAAVRWSIYAVLLLLLLIFGANSDSFIYFQF
ncbi:MBOAT family O-acyltransferase [Chryseobacterium koreense]|uniref:Acyltransferase n=1 Tax=Chryseobacterium koreense CCUG 49689 TaxID=1304281 RepID=A0A0J7LMV1_9FLAO|nr:MBOAT family O-acyltransferase [Chryseobacterium koreense]KMQ70425.1 acyltransferase [Chryseobacterium koreense CCUG 49689]MBB5333542.1 D-alanyl-lipoteichoic acid acyltransferase DltB (MBOAT superfamily) [Chryseobacterium koreense]